MSTAELVRCEKGCRDGMRKLAVWEAPSEFPCYAAPDFTFPGLCVLIELRLENYAVVDNLVAEFGRGLNLLTGETGAGKSILVDALALLLGEKASSDVIRAGADRAVVA